MVNNLSITCKIVSWNVRSILQENKLNFLQIIDDNGIQIACVCESWFDSSSNVKFTSMIKNAGFDMFVLCSYISFT